jgi:hypothetical protein
MSTHRSLLHLLHQLHAERNRPSRQHENRLAAQPAARNRDWDSRGKPISRNRPAGEAEIGPRTSLL